MRSPCSLFICKYPHLQLLNASTNLYETWYVYCNVLGYLTILRHVFTLLITSEYQI
jgi:hypothetical protein